MNNFQSYNNGVGVFGDMTTKENVINRAAIYNNSDAGIYFKNSSGNVLNDVRIYNNKIGIRTLYSSPNNNYHGELKLFNNRSGDFDGTNGND
jgi:parallel beta-helix repeat protein